MNGEGLRFSAVISMGLLASGVALVAGSVASGEAEVSLVVIFPVFSGSSAYFLLGTLLIVAGMLGGLLTLWTTASEVPPARARESPGVKRVEDAGEKSTIGGLVLIGPVPIAFGSNPRIAYAMLGLGVAIVLIVLSLFLLSLL